MIKEFEISSIRAIDYFSIYLLLLALLMKFFKIEEPYFSNILGNWNSKHKWSYAFTIGIGALLLPVGISLYQISFLLNSFDNSTTNISMISIFFDAALVGNILAPFLEEMIFRGLLFQKLRLKTGFAVAFFVSASVFGLFHGTEKFVITSLFGMILNLILYKIGSLWPCIFLHALNNAFFDFLGILHNSNLLPMQITENYAVIGLALIAISFFFLIILIHDCLIASSTTNNNATGTTAPKQTPVI